MEKATQNVLTDMKAWVPTLQDDKKLKLFDYVSLLIDNPKSNLMDLAHARMYHMIESYGIEWVENENGDNKPRYKFYEKEIYGLHDTLGRLTELFHSGGRLLPTRKRIIMLMGPVGGGKSTIGSLLKKGLEEYSETEAGKIYALVGCPIHEDPLHALPTKFREQLQLEHGFYIEGKLCPSCQYKLDKEFKGDFREFEVGRVFFSEQQRMGIGTFLPSDQKTQDVAELIGSLNLSKIAEIGIESDPRAYTFDGELNIANRGMVELVEMLKADQKFLYVFLTLAQENQIKTPKFPFIYEDLVILAHTNETEWVKFMGKSENEALRDRIITVLCPYVLEVDNETKIYEKEWGNSNDSKDVALAPRTFNLCSAFAILSRLDEPKDKNTDLVKKMKVYNGEQVEGLKASEVRQMRLESEREGMKGIGPRYIMNCISQAATRAREEYCNLTSEEKTQMCYGIDNIDEYGPSIDAIDMMRVLSEAIDNDPELNNEKKEEYRKLLEMAREELDKQLKEDIQKAFCFEFEQEAEVLFKNYLNNVIAFISKEKVKDPITGREIQADETLMKSVETMINISEGAKEQHRQSIVNRFSRAAQKGKEFDFNTHADLREAITKRIFEERKDTIQITTTALHPDKEKIGELNRVIRRLCDDGYTPYSAAKMVRYVGKLLNR
jgi:serine protein kinase